MTQRKVRIMGFYGQHTDVPFSFIPDGIYLKLLLHKEHGFKIEHEINIDDEHVTQFVGYNKLACGCGSVFGKRDAI